MSGYGKHLKPNQDEPSPIELALDQITAAAWADVIASPSGRLVVWDILSHCGLFRNPYRGNADTNVECGKQGVAQWILDQGISPSGPHILGEMMIEHARNIEAIEREMSDEHE